MTRYRRRRDCLRRESSSAASTSGRARSSSGACAEGASAYRRQPARLAGRAGLRRGCCGSESEEPEETGQQPRIDLENMPAPAEGILVTHFLIVRSVARSRAFCADVLGGQVVLEENPCSGRRTPSERVERGFGDRARRLATTIASVVADREGRRRDNYRVSRG